MAAIRNGYWTARYWVTNYWQQRYWLFGPRKTPVPFGFAKNTLPVKYLFVTKNADKVS